ncbi:MAG: HlyD family efflux transporter periplasmic adaptor subunit [Cyanobacteria bacterium J007]|nr:MAG: HlyD family efflux transporter periplasmic adaptor subunit [Cyanobacteria bacterium J007]
MMNANSPIPRTTGIDPPGGGEFVVRSPDNIEREASQIVGGVAISPSARSPSPIREEQETPAPAFPETAGDRADWSGAVQHLLDQPAAGLTRYWLAGSLIFCAIFLTWAAVGTVEEVGRAPGSLVPQGQVYKIHPAEMGKVTRLAVAEGERVGAGAVLVELDPEMARLEVERLEEQGTAYRLQERQTRELIASQGLEAKTREAIARAEIAGGRAAIAQAESRVATVGQLLEQLRAEVRALEIRRDRLEPLQETSTQLLEQLEGDVATWERRRDRLEPLARQTEVLIAQLEEEAEAQRARVARLEPLVEEGAISQEFLFQAEQALRQSEEAIVRAQLSEQTIARDRLDDATQNLRDRATAILKTQLSEQMLAEDRLFEIEQSLRDREAKIAETEGNLSEAIAELERLEAQLAQTEAEAERARLESRQQLEKLALQLTEIQGKIGETEKLLDTAKAKLARQFIKAPVSGIVLSLAMDRPGEVVEPGQEIATIAPEQLPLILSAHLPEREAGFVKKGMAVQVKFDAYPYQTYGIIPGTVTYIAPDSQEDRELGKIYRVDVSLAKTAIEHQGKTIHFKPGQTAIAEIVIRERKIADVLLDPIRKIKESGITF